MRNSLKALFAVAALAGAPLAVTALSTPAFADLAADKATVDAAKAAGTVGEQGDGYLGLVGGSAPANVTAAVNAINDGRRQVYAQTAGKTGVTPEAAGQATGAQLIAKTPAGQYIKPLGGDWTKK
ncbi:MAG: YdbL family protein [Alphaproteobacteria bacterium]|nr:YdbL family protein [Alphaproteobacteria bacterium]